MAANETLVNAAKASRRTQPSQTYSGLGGIQDTIGSYLDHKIDMKRDEEKRAADEEYQAYLDEQSENKNEEVLESNVEEIAAGNEGEGVNALDPKNIKENYEDGVYKGDMPDKYPLFVPLSSGTQLDKSPLKYNASLVASVGRMYANKRYANTAMQRALGESLSSIDGTIDDFMTTKKLENEAKKEEERLKKEKEQQERDRQETSLNNFVYKNGENNIDQLGSNTYNQVQDQLYSLKEEYLAIYDEPDGPEKQKKLNNIMLQMQQLDGTLTSHSKELNDYKTNIDNNLYSDGMDGDVKSLMGAYYTDANDIEYDGQNWNFNKTLVDGKMQMVLTNPNAQGEIEIIENKIRALNEQKDHFSEEEYNTALASHEEDLLQYKRVINPSTEFTSSAVFSKTDGQVVNDLFTDIEKAAYSGQVLTMSEITNHVNSAIKDPKVLVSYANDAIPGQGKSMKEHFEEMFPDGIPVEDENGDFLEYRTIDQIFNPRNSYYRENDGEKVLQELVADYYSRIGINKFNKNKTGNATIVDVTDNTTFGMSKEEGDAFRLWMYDDPERKQYAEDIDLDKIYGGKTSYYNKYIKEAWEKYGEDFKKDMQIRQYDDLVSKYSL